MLIQASNKKYVYFEIDDEDFDKVAKYKWLVDKNGYIQTKIKSQLVSLHRFLLNLQKGDGKIVDHANGNKLDNRRSNLRLCTKQQNIYNSKPMLNTASKYKGVRKNYNGWTSVITRDGKKINLGYFTSEVEAAEYYDIAAYIVHKEFAYYNFPDKIESYKLHREILIKKRNKTSSYTGVSFKKSSNKWEASISINKQRIFLGGFENEIDAAKKYDEFVITNNLNRKLNFENRDNNT